MTRSSQVTHALSAMKNERATRARSQQASIKFLIFEDNGGDYCWTLVAASGEPLAQSIRFASHRKATRAARIARAGAASAPIEDHTADTPTADPAARRRIAIEHDNVVTHRSRSSTKAGEISMDNKHVDQGKGRRKKAAGSLTGDRRHKNVARRDQATASARNAVDKVVDTLPGRGTE
jgi:uncharacterized protein YegP (UPF0339 family)/uncharacterized protein YjbJ (UPF0337 family)